MGAFNFIFMLTRNDRTVRDAADHVTTALEAGVRHIGFKDIGLGYSELDVLNRAIRDNGASSYLEIVSVDRASEITSVKIGIELGVNYLLGGTHADDALPLLEGTGIRYYPFPGRISGHPSVLEGSIEEIVNSAQALASLKGVDGLDLLAYRSDTDAPALMNAVCAAVAKPVIVAGSVATPSQIRAIQASGASGFTIGTAALEGRFPANDLDLATQLRTILDVPSGDLPVARP